MIHPEQPSVRLEGAEIVLCIGTTEVKRVGMSDHDVREAETWLGLPDGVWLAEIRRIRAERGIMEG